MAMLPLLKYDCRSKAHNMYVAASLFIEQSLHTAKLLFPLPQFL